MAVKAMVARTSIAASGKRLGAGEGRAEDMGERIHSKGVGRKGTSLARKFQPQSYRIYSP